ncbi:MAG: cupin-like domain-containing protein [Sinimarinibacterium sp.]|jgi:hypothetical protein
MAALSNRLDGTHTPSPARVPHLSINPVTFAADFDRRPFYLEHRLRSHPLFELPAMAALSERLYPHLVEWNAGHAGAYGKPDQIKPPALPCKEAILAVGERPAWILLRQIEHDPPYKALVDELLDEIKPFSEQSRPGMYQREAFLFISSREAVTPFHFDPEHNFLLQVRGRKTVHMWDANNRVVLPEIALDEFYANVRSNRDQPYRDDFLASAWVLPLNAGQGVHFPLHAAHWVKTESDVSVSLSITFRTRLSKFSAGVHCANGHVRRFGLVPPAPGTSRLWDIAAQFAYFLDRRLRQGYSVLREAGRFAASFWARLSGRS